LRRNCLLKHVFEGKIEGSVEVTRRRGRRGKQVLDDNEDNEHILKIERGSTGSRCVENSLWKRLWTCRKTDYRMNDYKGKKGAKIVELVYIS
jgi:hypothetical protein